MSCTSHIAHNFRKSKWVDGVKHSRHAGASFSPPNYIFVVIFKPLTFPFNHKYEPIKMGNHRIYIVVIRGCVRLAIQPIEQFVYHRLNKDFYSCHLIVPHISSHVRILGFGMLILSVECAVSPSSLLFFCFLAESYIRSSYFYTESRRI